MIRAQNKFTALRENYFFGEAIPLGLVERSLRNPAVLELGLFSF